MTTSNTARLHPAIGQLCRKGETIYYAHLADDLYVEGTVEELACYLKSEERCGLRATSSAEG